MPTFPSISIFSTAVRSSEHIQQQEEHARANLTQGCIGATSPRNIIGLGLVLRRANDCAKGQHNCGVTVLSSQACSEDIFNASSTSWRHCAAPSVCPQNPTSELQRCCKLNQTHQNVSTPMSQHRVDYGSGPLQETLRYCGGTFMHSRSLMCISMPLLLELPSSITPLMSLISTLNLMAFTA